MLLIAVALFVVWRLVSSRMGLVSITSADLERRLSAGEQLLVVDVREPMEFKQGHVKGARLVPLGTLGKGDHGLPKEKQIVLVCRSGNRSAQAFQILKKQGYTNLLNLTGGMSGWSGPVVR
jgi:rhodanese-related sulfurtransferase